MCVVVVTVFTCRVCFFFQAEDGIRDLVRSRGLGDVYKRQKVLLTASGGPFRQWSLARMHEATPEQACAHPNWSCLLYTSDAADERSSVDLGGRRIIKKKKTAAQYRSARSPSKTTQR